MKKYINSFGLIFFASSFSYGAGAFSPKYSPEASPQVLLMRNENTYLKKAAPDFWTLIPYAEGMRTGHSASAASMATVLNGLRKDRRYSSSDEMVTEEGLLKKVKIENWAIATSDQNPLELTLKQMESIANTSFAAYDLKGVKAKAFLISDDNQKSLERIRSILTENEKSNHDFVIAHYIQSEFTGDPEGAVGTWSPVGAFDATNDRVLILETDRKYYEPYWVSLKVFVQGLAHLKDKKSQQHVGGLILIK